MNNEHKLTSYAKKGTVGWGYDNIGKSNGVSSICTYIESSATRK